MDNELIDFNASLRLARRILAHDSSGDNPVSVLLNRMPDSFACSQVLSRMSEIYIRQQDLEDASKNEAMRILEELLGE